MKVTLHNRPYYGTPEGIVRKLREQDHGQPRDVDTYFLVSAIKIGFAQPVFHPEHLDSHAIRVLRKVRGLSKEKLAHQLGVALMTINRWEDGSTAAEPKRFDMIQRVLFEQAILSIQRKKRTEMVIYKYPVTPGEFSVSLPTTATVVTVQMQGNEPQMGASVDPGSPPSLRRFKAVGTGEPFESTWRYIGTFQMHGGELVFHLLEEP